MFLVVGMNEAIFFCAVTSVLEYGAAVLEFILYALFIQALWAFGKKLEKSIEERKEKTS